MNSFTLEAVNSSESLILTYQDYRKPLQKSMILVISTLRTSDLPEIYFWKFFVVISCVNFKQFTDKCIMVMN